MFGHLLLQNETYTDHVTYVAQIIHSIRYVFGPVSPFEELIFNYHVFDSSSSLPLFFVPYYWHVIIIIIIIIIVIIIIIIIIIIAISNEK